MESVLGNCKGRNYEKKASTSDEALAFQEACDGVGWPRSCSPDTEITRRAADVLEMSCMG